jgi:dihydrofolate reductase
MSKVISNISMSLDGFMAGPNIRHDEPMGENGELLHDWMFNAKTSGESKSIQAEFFNNIGAYIIGKRTLDVGLVPWGDNPPFHAPCFILSSKSHDTIIKQGGTSFTFITSGIESALMQAREASGSKDVIVMGGANTIQQYLSAGLIDQLYLHLPHILLGTGTKLFDNLTIAPTKFEKISSMETTGVTHLKFRIVK